MTRARRAIALLALAAGACSSSPVWEQPPPPVADRPIVDAARLHRTTLDNGLRVVVLEDPRLPRVELGITLRRGAAIVPPDSAGLAAFTAALLQRGAGERDALQLAEAVDNLGASFAARADWDSTQVGVSGLSRDLEPLLSILADLVLRPRFEQSEASKLRSETLAGLERAKDDPGTLAGWYAAEILYPGHRFGRPLGGSAETVARLDAGSARAFHARVFLPENAIFSAAGSVSAAELLPQVRAAFGAWRGSEVPDPGPPPPAPAPAERRIVVVDRPDLVQAQILVAHEGIARSDPARIATGLMNAALGSGGFLSRLMTRVRAEEGLTYGVYSAFSLRRSPGPFVISTFTRVPEVRRVVDLLLAEMDEMRSSPPVGREFRDIQSQQVGRFALGLETSGALVDALVDLDVYGLPADSLDTYRARVRAVTPDEVARAARERLHPRRAAIVAVGPAAELRPQLESLGPVEVVEP